MRMCRLTVPILGMPDRRFITVNRILNFFTSSLLAGTTNDFPQGLINKKINIHRSQHTLKISNPIAISSDCSTLSHIYWFFVLLEFRIIYTIINSGTFGCCWQNNISFSIFLYFYRRTNRTRDSALLREPVITTLLGYRRNYKIENSILGFQFIHFSHIRSTTGISQCTIPGIQTNDGILSETHLIRMFHSIVTIDIHIACTPVSYWNRHLLRSDKQGTRTGSIRNTHPANLLLIAHLLW